MRGGDGPVFKIGDFSYSLKDIENLKDPDNTLVQFARALDGMRSPKDEDLEVEMMDDLDRPGATLLPGTVKEKREVEIIAQEFILAAQRGFLSESNVESRVLDDAVDLGRYPNYFQELVRNPRTEIDGCLLYTSPSPRD